MGMAALNRRLHTVGMLSDLEYRMLCIQIAKNGRTKEPESAPREMSQVFPKIFDALHKNGISRARVATELSLPQSELEALMFGLALAGIEGGGKVRAAGELLFRP